MAVLLVEHLGEDSTVPLTTGGNFRTQYHVQTDNQKYNHRTLIQDAVAWESTPSAGDGLPALGSPYFSEADLYLSNYTIEQQRPDHKTHYVCTANYEPQTWDIPAVGTDPATWEPVYWLEAESMTVPVGDAESLVAMPNVKSGAIAVGDRVSPVNALGEPYDPPPARLKRVNVLCIRRNYTLLSAITALQRDLDNTYNSATWQGYPAKQVHFKEIATSPKQFYFGFTYYACTFRWRLYGSVDDSALVLPNRSKNEYLPLFDDIDEAFTPNFVAKGVIGLNLDGTEATSSSPTKWLPPTPYDYGTLGFPTIP